MKAQEDSYDQLELTSSPPSQTQCPSAPHGDLQWFSHNSMKTNQVHASLSDTLPSAHVLHFLNPWEMSIQPVPNVKLLRVAKKKKKKRLPKPMLPQVSYLNIMKNKQF